MLKVKNLVVAYDRLTVVRGVSFDVPRGSLVALLGSNGAGKTTILNAIAGLTRTISGELVFANQHAENWTADSRFRKGIALVPQGRHLFPEMTVAENLEMGAVCLPLSLSELNGRLDEAYLMFPRLQERARQRAASLSGGEQQMLATARALISRPSLLLLDEPTTGLAPLIVDELGRICNKLKSAGQTILLVEQNLDMALDVADYVYVLRGGEIVSQSERSALQSREEMFKSYIGL